VIDVFYTDMKGSICKIEVGSGPNSDGKLLKDLWAGLVESQHINPKDFSWFRQSLEILPQSIIYSGDRLLALRVARLPPAVWRVQRVHRISQYVK
jgi:hypothetical protein